ncbi:uncharacterized protein LOC115227422 [Octopus sinensis]|uniref:Uncharacterized protein LOC115227422 n=1 Tax=Octopus sinensis TaxID=2607531 RepID=A0A6P7TPJ2_9MOLL|nr:uncharacterized protein LOC115227422 [Octopus sinensis]
MHQLKADVNRWIIINECLREDIRRNQPDLRSVWNWIVHDNNALCHRDFNMVSLLHPSDLAAADLHLFPKMKMQLKGNRLNTVVEIKSESQKILHSFTEIDFKVGSQKWRER